MLIPLGDTQSLYAAMMIDLIAQQTAHPHSHRWEAPNIQPKPRRNRLPFFGRFLPRRRSGAFAPAV
jgi:hypothetical protein